MGDRRPHLFQRFHATARGKVVGGHARSPAATGPTRDHQVGGWSAGPGSGDGMWWEWVGHRGVIMQQARRRAPRYIRPAHLWTKPLRKPAAARRSRRSERRSRCGQQQSPRGGPLASSPAHVDRSGGTPQSPTRKISPGQPWNCLLQQATGLRRATATETETLNQSKKAIRFAVVLSTALVKDHPQL